MNHQHYITLGMDKDGQIYGIPVDENGNFDKLNPPSCNVIRPVSQETLDYCRNDEESMLEDWQNQVQAGMTRLGLKEFFEEAMSENGDPEWWPGKDESFVDDLIASNGVGEPDKVLFQDCLQDAEKRLGEKLGTWEAAGWWTPSERFEVVYGPRELVDDYYAAIRI